MALCIWTALGVSKQQIIAPLPICVFSIYVLASCVLICQQHSAEHLIIGVEMALLIRRFAPTIMEGSSLRPNKQPLRIHHRAWGGRQLLVPHGDYRRRAGNGAVLLFVASSSAITNGSSSVSAWWPAAAPGTGGCLHLHRDPSLLSSSAAKNLLQQLQPRFAPAQGRRVFCSLADYCSKEVVDPGRHDIGGSPAAMDPENAWKEYAKAKNQLDAALARNNSSNIDGQQVLKNLRTLTWFAGDRGYYAKEYMAKELLKAAVVGPLSKDLHRHGRLHGVVRESLALARLLLKNAPEPVAKKLRGELRPVLLKIVRDCGGGEHQKSADELRELRELRELARSVLKAPELPPT
ncbi:hypothetical protein BS78_05G022500 [Paspalum vaginatum]|nr:hypothetical protein BS78_05G022500 [Paspalum vaginatum]